MSVTDSWRDHFSLSRRDIRYVSCLHILSLFLPSYMLPYRRLSLEDGQSDDSIVIDIIRTLT